MLNVTTWVRLLVITCLLCAGNLSAETQRVIVHQNYVGDGLSRNTARAIFSMRLKRWENGEGITVFVLPDSHPVHRKFTRKVLALFPHQLRRSWDRYVYSGIGTAPIEVEDENDMVSKVAATPGSIGYTSKETLDADVRTLFVK
ncbi:hypothetical protein imdm_1814 [gamma proteobacterium IMCC2047]|nr:hypothetical protein imdm_1814 [gamma proteobacterium IMCC2047]